MAGNVSKQDQALNRGAQMVSSARDDLDGRLKALRGKLGGLQAQWQGAGAASFTNTITRWDADAAKIINALNDFEANLRQSEQDYNAADEQQSSTFTNLQSRLG